jgi:hypothetical protein
MTLARIGTPASQRFPSIMGEQTGLRDDWPRIVTGL